MANSQRAVASDACAAGLALDAGQEAALDEDLEGDAIEEDLAPVTLQLALVASRLGRHSEAAAAHQVGCAPPACLL